MPKAKEKKLPPILRTIHNVKTAYAIALEGAGLRGAIQNIDVLLDKGYQEKFADYYPDKGAFGTFRERFAITRRQTLKNFAWDFDVKLLDKDPEHAESVRGYFD